MFGRRSCGLRAAVCLQKSQEARNAVYGGGCNRQRIHSRNPQSAQKFGGNNYNRLRRVDRARRPARADGNGVRFAHRQKNENVENAFAPADCLLGGGGDVGGFPHSACGRAVRLRNRNRRAFHRPACPASGGKLRKLPYNKRNRRSLPSLRSRRRLPENGLRRCRIRGCYGRFRLAFGEVVASCFVEVAQAFKRQPVLVARPPRACGLHCGNAYNFLPRSCGKRRAHD